jgi:hypothetical protein
MELPAASVPHSVCTAYYHLVSAPAAQQRSRWRPLPRQRQGRCCAALKQHKTRIYILGRCLAMLLCWHDREESD